jgi:hypothetical protein
MPRAAAVIASERALQQCVSAGFERVQPCGHGKSARHQQLSHLSQRTGEDGVYSLLAVYIPFPLSISFQII